MRDKRRSTWAGGGATVATPAAEHQEAVERQYGWMMTGETDLDRLLATLSVSRRPGVFTVVALRHSDQPEPAEGIEAVINEGEGPTVICDVATAKANGWPVGFEAAWLTLEVYSALEAVGLTAAVAHVLAEAEIPCNVLAGFYHDHLLVPVERADEAIERLARLAT